MAPVAACRRVRIPAHSGVIRINGGLIAVLMAIDATERRVIGGICMAVSARGPDALLMCARINREPCVIEGGACPGRRRMTSCAGCRKPGAGMT